MINSLLREDIGCLVIQKFSYIIIVKSVPVYVCIKLRGSGRRRINIVSTALGIS